MTSAMIKKRNELIKKWQYVRRGIVISNWMSSYSTIDFLAMWEELYNPNFNRMEFHTVRNEPGRLVMTASQWIEKMNAIGIISKAGRYGGTYAHSDIAFEFASWVSLEFKLYLIKDYQRLKKDEAERLLIGWDAKRELSKINYRIHTNADYIRQGLSQTERLKLLREKAYRQLQVLRNEKNSLDGLKKALISDDSETIEKIKA